MSDSEASSVQPGDLTTLHVRRAVGGSQESFRWLVERFTGLLIAQAHARLPASLLPNYEPIELVSDVWMDAEPLLNRLRPRDDRLTPVLLRFLSTMLLNRMNRRIREELRERSRVEPLPAAEPGASEMMSIGALAAMNRPVPSDLQKLIRRESRSAVHQAVSELSEPDRQVVVMRAIEQRPWSEIALVLNEKPNTLSVRFSRALTKLRNHLDGSVFDELPDG